MRLVISRGLREKGERREEGEAEGRSDLEMR